MKTMAWAAHWVQGLADFTGTSESSNTTWMDTGTTALDGGQMAEYAKK